MELCLAALTGAVCTNFLYSKAPAILPDYEVSAESSVKCEKGKNCRETWQRENTVPGRPDNHQIMQSFTHGTEYPWEGAQLDGSADPTFFNSLPNPSKGQDAIHFDQWEPGFGTTKLLYQDVVKADELYQPVGYGQKYTYYGMDAVTRAGNRQREIESKVWNASGGMDGFHPVDFGGYPERGLEVDVYNGIKAEGYANGAIMEPRPDPIHTTTRIFWPGENKRAQVTMQLNNIEQGTRVDAVYGGIGLVKDKGKTAPKTAVNDYYREPVPMVAPTKMSVEILNIGGGLKTSKRTEWTAGQSI